MTLKMIALAATTAFVSIATSAYAVEAGPPEAAGAPPAVQGQGGPPPSATGARRGAASRRPPGHQSRKYSGGQGSSWKTGKNSYGFQGTYGGCQYMGGAGPGGYRINKVCR